MAKKQAFRNYGRQSKDKTIKSLSIDKEVAAWIKAQAKAKGMSESAFANSLMRSLMR